MAVTVVREFANLAARILFGKGASAPSVTSYYVILLATGQTPTAAWTATNAAGGELAATGGYARQFLGRAFTASGATLTSNEHGLATNDTVYLVTTNTLPAGLSADTLYHVVSATTNTFGLATTQGGSAITTTNSGTGTHYLRKAPVFDTGADNRSESDYDLVRFTASGGDITFQGWALMAGATSTVANTTGTLVCYEYYGSAQTVSDGNTQPIRVKQFVSNQSTAAGV